MYCEKDSSHQSSYYEVNYYVHKVYLMLNVFLISYVLRDNDDDGGDDDDSDDDDDEMWRMITMLIVLIMLIIV